MSVQVKNQPYEHTKYQKVFATYPFELSDFQKWAIEAIHEKKNVMITAFTGSGKTLPAEEAIKFYHSLGKKSIYCSPVKALTNEKYNSFCKKFPEISFGIFTGDNKNNPEADCLLMTTEILANNLKHINDEKESGLLDFNMDYNNDLGVVIFDEFQYLFSDRGAAWNDTVVDLPKTVPIVALSATMSKPEKVCKWISEVTERETHLCPNYERVVPLEHYAFLTLTNHGNIKKIENEDKMFINDLVKTPLVLKKNNEFNEKTPNDIIKFKKLLQNNRIYMKKQFVLNEIAKYMKTHDDLPAIVFTYSRKGCYRDAASITTSLFQNGSNIPHVIAKECKTILSKKLDNWKEYTELTEYYKNSNIYIQASGYEGLPHVLLEAINYDLTVISTPIGGSNEILQDGKNGYVLNLEKGKKPNTENLKNIILETINKKELTEDKKKNAKMLLHSIFDENKNFPKYLEILKK